MYSAIDSCTDLRGEELGFLLRLFCFPCLNLASSILFCYPLFMMVVKCVLYVCVASELYIYMYSSNARRKRNNNRYLTQRRKRTVFYLYEKFDCITFTSRVNVLNEYTLSEPKVSSHYVLEWVLYLLLNINKTPVQLFYFLIKHYITAPKQVKQHVG